jgi:hypothetical protein
MKNLLTSPPLETVALLLNMNRLIILQDYSFSFPHMSYISLSTSRDSSVGIATRLRCGWLKSLGSVTCSGRDFSLLHSVKGGYGPTQPTIQ